MILPKAMIKLLFIMGTGIVLSLPVPFINQNKVEKIVIRQDGYIYQVNKRRGQIEKIYIFDKQGNPKGLYEYDELEPKHRKTVNQLIK